MESENHEFSAVKCETTVESVTQPKKRGRKPKNAVHVQGMLNFLLDSLSLSCALNIEGNGVEEGESVASSVSEAQTKDTAIRLKNEQVSVDSTDAVPMADSEISPMDNLNKKKSEVKNNKVTSFVCTVLYVFN